MSPSDPTTTTPASGTSSTPAPAGQDFFDAVTSEVGAFLNRMIRILSDPDAGPAILAELGWEGPAPPMPAQLLARVDPDGSAHPTLETFAEVVVAFDLLADALLAADDSADSNTVAEVIADLLDLAMVREVRTRWPGAWAILRATELLVDDFALSNFGELFQHPKDYFVDVVAPAVAGEFRGPDYVKDYAAYSLLLAAVGVFIVSMKRYPRPRLGPEDWLDPHGHDVSAFGLDVLYGWALATPAEYDPTDPHNPQPNLLELLSRMLTVRFDWQAKSTPASPAAPHVEIDGTLALVPGEHTASGHGGLFARLSELTEAEFPIGDGKWQVTVATTNGQAIEAMLGADDSFIRFVGGDAANAFKASVALERPADVSGSSVPVFLGSLIEVQHARAALTVSADDQRGFLLDAGFQSDHVILDIEIGQDSFLRAVLPPSLRLDTKIGVGYEAGKQGRGAYLNGGVTLVVDLPVSIPPIGLSVGSTSIVALVVQGLHLRLGFEDVSDSGTGSVPAFTVAFTVDASVQLVGGVVTATVSGVGYQYQLKDLPPGTAADGTPTAGRWQPSGKWVPPKGVGLVVKSGPVNGGGFIGYDPTLSEYTGVVQLGAEIAGTKFDLAGIGMLDTKIPDHPDDWSLLVILTCQLSGYQLGSGFELTGLGGIFGHNHTIDSDAIAAGLRTRALDAILFPPNPVAQAPHIFAVWRQTLPQAAGSSVVGIMFQFSWGSTDLSEFEVALLVDFSTPVQVVLLVSLQLHAPSKSAPFVRCRVDGIARLPNFLLQAELVDSKIGGVPVSGGVVALAREDPKVYLFAAGGFNPHFTPPDNVPVPDRIRLDLSSGPHLKFLLEAYFAITSQTVQLGAHIQFHASAGPLAIDVSGGFDALVADVGGHWYASLELALCGSLSFDGSPIIELNVDVLFEYGYGQRYIHGYASLSLLFVTYTLPIDDGNPIDMEGPTSTAADPVALARDALSKPEAWSAPAPGASSVVSLRAPSGQPGAAHPLGVVSCTQGVVPLGLQITRVAGQPLSTPATVTLTGLTLGGAAAPGAAPVTGDFAPGQFLDLTDDEKLSRPSFEAMQAGVTAADNVDAGGSTVVAATYKTVAVDGTTRTTRPPWLLDAVHATAVLRPPAPVTARPAPVQLAVSLDTLRTFAGQAGGPQTFALAAQRAGSQQLLDLVGVAGSSS